MLASFFIIVKVNKSAIYVKKKNTNRQFSEMSAQNTRRPNSHEQQQDNKKKMKNKFNSSRFKK